MADQPRGRGRGRGRGRARGAVPAPAALAQAAPAPVPVAAPAVQAQAGGRGRGRARGATAVAAPVAAPPVAGGRGRGAVQRDAEGLPAQFGQLAIGDGSGTPQERGSVRPIRETGLIPITKPASISCTVGTEGIPVDLSANYFEVLTKPTWTLCKHHVDFSPEEDRSDIKKKLMRQHQSSFPNGYLFDGSTLFTCVNACPNGRSRQLVSTWREGRNEDGSEILKQYTLTLKLVGTVERTEFQYLQIFGLIQRECMGMMNLKPVRRNFFDPEAKICIKSLNLDIWPGYATSFLQCETRVLLQCEIKHCYVRKDTVLDLFRNKLQEFSRQPDRFKTEFTNATIGSVIMTKYNDTYYRIDEIDFDKTPRDTFERKVRGQVTHVKYADYVRERYGMECSDLGQPMLISRSNARQRRAGQDELIYLIPEFCIFTGLSEQLRTDHRFMREISAETCVTPSGRIQRLRAFNRRLTTVPEVKAKLSSWGLQLAPDLVRFKGRILPPEKIVLHGAKQFETGPNAEWDRHLRTNQMLQSVDINTWVVIFPRRVQGVQQFCDMLQRAARGMRYTIAVPKFWSLERDGAGDYTRAVMEAIDEHNPQIVLFIFAGSGSDSSRYNAVKKRCILEKPIPSQVVLQKNITEKKAMSVATKVAIQMNCKMGGAPWGVAIPIKGLMTIGYDVCHDPADKRRSYGAVVASMDENCVRWYSNVTRHPAGEELSINFALNVEKAICAYRSMHEDALPSIIVIYRDGVGEGQIDQVRAIEVENIKKALEPMYEKVGRKLRMAFVIVTKRINTRIFKAENNPPPGTIVDNTITSPFKYDFYLVSQSVRQGTVTPTYYNVIEDTTGWGEKVDRIQRLTYKFTHLYFNWSGTVRVPAPCQYAHKLAFLTAQSVMIPHSNMEKVLYFL